MIPPWSQRLTFRAKLTVWWTVAFGLLLAVAILTDALVVRMTLVPAFLTLMGEKAWYIPRWLDRLLPDITIEPPHERGVEPRVEPRPEPTEA